MDRINLAQVNSFVLKKQHLTDDSKINDVVQITKDIGGLHGTSATGPYLSVFARSRSFRKDDLSDEISKRKSLARIRYVRNTIYILSEDFIPVAYAATSQMAEVTSERFSKQLGITPAQYVRIANKIQKVLRGRGLTTREIRKKLRTAANIAPVVNLMCDRGLLVRSLPREGWKSTQHSYFLFDDYYPNLDLKAYDEKEARKKIILQHLLSFGPVSEQDIVWWTGFPKSQVQDIIQELGDDVLRIHISELGDNYLIHSSEKGSLQSLQASEHPNVNVLPSLDPYLMAYKGRERYLHPKHYKMVFDRSGNATSTVLVDGRVVGIWDLEEPLVKVFFLRDVGKDIRKKIRAKASDMGKFVTEKPVQVKVCDSMVPLPKRTAGSFMSPLKDC